MEENTQNNINEPENPVVFPEDVEAEETTHGDDTGQAPVSEEPDGFNADAVVDKSDAEDTGEASDVEEWDDGYGEGSPEDYKDIFKFNTSQPSDPPIAPEPAFIPDEVHSFDEDDFREQRGFRGKDIDPIWFVVAAIVITVIFMNIFGTPMNNTSETEETSDGNDGVVGTYDDKDKAVKAGTYKMESFNIHNGVCTLSYFGKPMPEQPLSRVYIPSSFGELFSWKISSQMFAEQVLKIGQAESGDEHSTSLLFSRNYKLVPDANSKERERAVVTFVPETISSGDGKQKLEDVNGHWEFELHYWPARSEAEEYKLVEYKGNGTNRGTITYELASGATDTVEVFPYDVDVADDGRGVVEKRWGYVKDGDVVSWEHHWVVHSL